MGALFGGGGAEGQMDRVTTGTNCNVKIVEVIKEHSRILGLIHHFSLNGDISFIEPILLTVFFKFST